ncbi:MAG: radical SAM protein [Bacteroidales bacterium]|nr:radical SAM protein [Bacteroidales bacterium]
MGSKCELVNQGYKTGSCLVYKNKEKGNACDITLKTQNGIPKRLIKSAHLSRPEHYFSIYQSGCNLSCKKCHSWNFTKYANGEWLSPGDILDMAEQYSQMVTVNEPRERSTSYHALDLCRSCGSCVDIFQDSSMQDGTEQIYLYPTGKKGNRCPNKINPDKIVLSPQGFGPARNIIAFTGGDIGCRTEFYEQSSELIKKGNLNLWILFETNGYGLTPKNLDKLKAAGVDSYWLDIKTFEPDVHKRLTGVTNEWILRLPEEIIKRDFVLEVLTLVIPGWVEEDQIGAIAKLIYQVDRNIPFTILAFFPEYKMKNVPAPNIEHMLKVYETVRETGLVNVRLANLGVFAKTESDYQILLERAGEAI